jgi:hypothetical protein
MSYAASSPFRDEDSGATGNIVKFQEGVTAAHPADLHAFDIVSRIVSATLPRSPLDRAGTSLLSAHRPLHEGDAESAVCRTKIVARSSILAHTEVVEH